MVRCVMARLAWARYVKAVKVSFGLLRCGFVGLGSYGAFWFSKAR